MTEELKDVWRNAVLALRTRIILNLGKLGKTLLLAPMLLLPRGGAIDLAILLTDYLAQMLTWVGIYGHIWVR